MYKELKNIKNVNDFAEKLTNIDNEKFLDLWATNYRPIEVKDLKNAYKYLTADIYTCDRCGAEIIKGDHVKYETDNLKKIVCKNCHATINLQMTKIRNFVDVTFSELNFKILDKLNKLI